MYFANVIFIAEVLRLKNLELTDILLNVSRYAFLFIGTFLFVNAILATFMSSASFGVIMTYVLGFIFTAFGAAYNFLPHRLCVIFTLFLLVLFITLCVIFVLLYALDTPKVDYTEDAVIVLGSGLRGEEVGYVLRTRLDACLEYLDKNTECLVVVSGGKGSDELISEAEAMERYLVAHGIERDRIIKEDVSTSTLENFENSKGLLDTRLGKSYTVAYITSDYHSYRAGRIFTDVFGEDVRRVCSDTPFFALIPNGLREICAIIKHVLF